jgi:hypothetical protein
VDLSPPTASWNEEALHYKLAQVPRKIREMAWKAQSRLTARYRALSRRGKKTTVVCAAIARELVGLMWAIAHEVLPANLPEEVAKVEQRTYALASRRPPGRRHA